MDHAYVGWIGHFKAYSMFLSHEDFCSNSRSVNILNSVKDSSLSQQPSYPYTFFSIYSYIFAFLHWKRMETSAAVSVTVTNTEPSSLKESCGLFRASPDVVAKNVWTFGTAKIVIAFFQLKILHCLYWSAGKLWDLSSMLSSVMCFQSTFLFLKDLTEDDFCRAL